MPIHPETQKWLNSLPLYAKNPLGYKQYEGLVPAGIQDLPEGYNAFKNPQTGQVSYFDQNFGRKLSSTPQYNKCGQFIGNKFVEGPCNLPGNAPRQQAEQSRQNRPPQAPPPPMERITIPPDPPRYVGATQDTGVGGQPRTQQIPNGAVGGSQNLQLPLYTPEQGDIMNSLLLQGIGNFNSDALEQQARSQFNKKAIPTLAERFTMMGDGAQRSSAFQGQLGEAGSELEELLASLRGGVGQSQLGMGLQPSYENVYLPGGGGFLQGLQQGGAQGIADMVGPAMKAGLNWYTGNSAEPAYQLGNGQYTGMRANSAPVTSNTGAWLNQLMDMFKNVR